MGVAIADLDFVRDELADGRLVAPFEFVLRDGMDYVLIAERDGLAEPKLGMFRDWLLAELAADGSGGRP